MPIALTTDRPVAVTSGAHELRYIVVTETAGEDISDVTITACIAELGVTPLPEEYAEPDFDVASSEGTGEDERFSRKIGVMVTGDNAIPGRDYLVWALVATSPETPALATPVAFPVV
jgi:hypothetical protein